MIVISPSRGTGATTIGGSISLFDGEYSGSESRTYFRISKSGDANGREVTVAGPGSWTWRLTGAARDYQVYCQPITGSVQYGSAATNSWIGLNTTREWTRASALTVLSISIRDIATATVQATCTITLTD